MRVTVYLRRRPEAGLVQAYCPDVPGCSSCGKTEDEALATLRRRIASQLGSDKAPPPGVRVVALEI
ncbi:MAG TPA: type II toxin-antitoxin system HicB family antitoxin [Kofleriaceae bacterium]|jgi:predicted RNase H-like HicB family nuclease|nr:type II toxin-antitoxin system HicB family antitoxin [Kofleriaceae bacterium]